MVAPSSQFIGCSPTQAPPLKAFVDNTLKLYNHLVANGIGLAAAMAIADDPDAVLVGTTDGVFATSDGGVAWTKELTGTTTELNLADFSRANGLDMQPVVFEDNKVRDATYLEGGCDAITKAGAEPLGRDIDHGLQRLQEVLA